MRQLVPSHVENESRQMFRSISCKGKAQSEPAVGRKRWQPGELQQLERSGYAVPGHEALQGGTRRRTLLAS